MPDIMEWTVGEGYDTAAGCKCTCHCGCSCSGGTAQSTTRTNTATDKCDQLKDGNSGWLPYNPPIY